ncbi:hypothetical protein FH972_001627 [Carpinus fangiana]|uniref:Fe2OG dioxygenase domain-containing protein n=1 Tax=Carpinus fangiana TaxID=176857 RepID=A0A5N6QEQ1_9ROSI|nr:hypothetical protein FH972_001627 [Carpinus fangiana]
MQPPLDPHEKPPESLKALYKRYQKADAVTLEADDSIVCLDALPSESWRRVDRFTTSDVQQALRAFHRGAELRESSVNAFVEAYESKDIPVAVQQQLLSYTFHRDLSIDQHKTNVHFHHDISYPFDRRSFFDYDPSRTDFLTPKDSVTHKQLSLGQFFNRRLRWLTLGGQYDWTAKQYPNERPPTFPAELGDLLQGVFPETRAEAAIVNLYSPGDVLSLHRDVSEFCDRGLISLSIGCDGVFMLGGAHQRPEEPSKCLAIRLRSGDAVYMTGPSRYAWHGVPQIIAHTCPTALQAWPASMAAEDTTYEQWRNWMASKRINLNVRQMYQ